MPLSDADPFKKALDAYNAKRFDESYKYAREALSQRPDNPGCLHLVGALEFCFGRRDEAEMLMRRSIELGPGFAQMHYSFAQVLAANGKHAEAVQQYACVLKLKPEHADALFGLGNAFASLGERAKSIEAYEGALRLRPDFPEALNNLGVFKFEDRAFEDAIRMTTRAIELRPRYAAAFNNLGNVYKEKQDWFKAISCYRKALAIDPALHQAMNNLGLAMMYGGSDIGGAAECFHKVLEIDPKNPGAMTHYGITLCMQGDFDGAIAWYQKALEVDANHRDALNNLANALRAIGRVDEAITYYERVRDMRADDPDIQNNLALAYLTAGRFDEGWQAYEARFGTEQLRAAKRPYTQPQWRGEKGRGRTLLIFPEQGFGDFIQFCRLAPLAAERGWRVVLEAPHELVALAKSLAGVEKVVALGSAPSDFDAYCPLMSLPFALGLKVETIPATVPYLFADKAKAQTWRERMANDPKGLRVGLVWTGNPRLFSIDLSAGNTRRSLRPDSFAALKNLSGIQFYSLQKNGFELTDAPEIIDYMAECHDFADTAALIENLDLVISVDTSVAHLAGAMGKPVWLLNRVDTCWRWFRDRTDSPWYPTMRIFRQPKSCDWTSVIRDVSEALGKIVKKAST